jgi:hypothetical protein
VTIYQHGPVRCRECFDAEHRAVTTIEADGFRLVNDPGYWGAPDPVVLVLGQSKGRNQWTSWGRDFDDVAFAGIRDRLRSILERVGIPVEHDDIDACFRADERLFGFASLVRCSLNWSNGGSSGSPVMSAMGSSSADAWVRTCMARWLTHLNPRLRLVILLGITDAYVSAVIERLRAVHPASFRIENRTTVHAAGVVWTFVQHPSRLSKNHYRRWVGDDPSSKRDAAHEAVRIALGDADPNEPRSLGLNRSQEVPRMCSTRTPPSARREQRQGASSAPIGPALRCAIQDHLAQHPGLVRHGALKLDNKKMSDWRTRHGVVLAYEHEYSYLWAPDHTELRELMAGSRGKCYPASQLWQEPGADGKPRYGRHSALKAIPELRDSDLIRFTLHSIADFERILDHIRRL